MEIEAMDAARDLISSYGYPISENFVYSLNFLIFEGNKVRVTRKHGFVNR